MPIISVVMAVKDPLKTYPRRWIDQSIQSILNQTFDDIEFILVNYGEMHIEGSIDPRLRVIRGGKSFTSALNIGIKNATGKYLARQDIDDWSSKDRLEKQHRFLEESDSSVVICGTYSWWWIGNNDPRKEKKNPTMDRMHRPLDSNKMRSVMRDGHNPLIHGSVMFKRGAVLNDIGLYNESYVTGQDFEYWCRVLKRFDGSNVPEYLYNWRQHSLSVSAQKSHDQLKNRARVKHLARKWFNEDGTVI